MHWLKVISEKYDHSVTMLTETRVGYVVYADELQVVAEPLLRHSDRVKWLEAG